jgi:hypothetical protein
MQFPAEAKEEKGATFTYNGREYTVIRIWKRKIDAAREDTPSVSYSFRRG